MEVLKEWLISTAKGSGLSPQSLLPCPAASRASLLPGHQALLFPMPSPPRAASASLLTQPWLCKEGADASLPSLPSRPPGVGSPWAEPAWARFSCLCLGARPELGTGTAQHPSASPQWGWKAFPLRGEAGTLLREDLTSEANY